MIAVPLEFTYTLLAAALTGLWLILYVLNSNGRKAQVRMGLLFLLFLPLELIYVHDYWHPVAHFAVHAFGGYVGIEDIFFGFSFGGMIAGLVEIFDKSYLQRNWFWVTFEVLGVYLISIFLWMVSVNSIFATSAAALLVVLLSSFLKAQLARRAMIGALCATVILFVVYAGGFFVSSNTESVLQSIWFLYGTPFGARLLGVPITELLWGVSFGAFAAIL